MAIKRNTTAPVKSKLRKRHGPKKHMFHTDAYGYSKCERLMMANAGVLNKYCDYESFKMACEARGTKSGIRDLWENFRLLKTKKEQDKFFATLNK